MAGLDPLTGAAHMLAQPFMARAFMAGTVIAAACGLVGYFVVLRGQVFTGDALSHIAFTGAMAALAAGVDLRIGLFGACVLFGVAMAGLGRMGKADDVVTGNTFAWVLGLGVLFLSIYTTSSHATDATAGVNVLFGSIFGLSGAQARVAAIIGLAVIAGMIVIARPLLFASVDESVAAAAGVPALGLGIAFLGLLGVTAGEATQAVGALLLLGLLSAPAAAAQRLTDRPWPAMALSVILAVGCLWVGLCLSYAVAVLPPSFSILAVATAGYLGAVVVSRRGRRRVGSGRRVGYRRRVRLGGRSG